MATIRPPQPWSRKVHALIVLAAALVTGGFLAAAAHAPPQTSADWAAWMQGAGSILTIAVSVAIVAWQAHRDRQQAREEAQAASERQAEAARAQREEYTDAVAELVGNAARVCRAISLIEFPHTPQAFDTMRAHIVANLDALASIDVARLPLGGLMTAVTEARTATKRLLMAVESAQASDFDKTAVMGHFRQLADELAVNVSVAASRFADAKKAGRT